MVQSVMFFISCGGFYNRCGHRWNTDCIRLGERLWASGVRGHIHAKDSEKHVIRVTTEPYNPHFMRTGLGADSPLLGIVEEGSSPESLRPFISVHLGWISGAQVWDFSLISLDNSEWSPKPRFWSKTVHMDWPAMLGAYERACWELPERWVRERNRSVTSGVGLDCCQLSPFPECKIKNSLLSWSHLFGFILWNKYLQM